MKKINFEIAWQAFVQWTKASVLMAIGLTLYRLVVYVTCYQHKVPFSEGIVKAFVAGVRFDVLILGFFWIPVWFWLWGAATFNKPNWIFQPARFYWVMSWTLFLFYQIFDLFFTAARGYRLNFESSNLDMARTFIEGTNAMGTMRAAVACFALMIIFVAIIRRMIALKEHALEPRSKLPVAVRIVLSLFLVALAARGTVTAHHLNIEHSIVSRSSEINQIPLNPIWNSDKKP